MASTKSHIEHKTHQNSSAGTEATRAADEQGCDAPREAGRASFNSSPASSSSPASLSSFPCTSLPIPLTLYTQDSSRLIVRDAASFQRSTEQAPGDINKVSASGR